MGDGGIYLFFLSIKSLIKYLLLFFKKFMILSSLDKNENDIKLGLSCYFGIRYFIDMDFLRSESF